MKPLHILATLLLFSVSFSYSQEKIKGNKNVTTVETILDNFHTLTLSDDFEVQLMKSNKSSVEVETDENLHDVIKFGVVNGELSFKYDMKIRSRKKQNIIIRYTDSLQNFVFKGNSQVNCFNTIDNDSINIIVKDKARFNLDIDTDYLNIRMNSRSGLSLKSRSQLNLNSKNADFFFNEGSKLEAIVRCDTLNVLMQESPNLSIEGKADFLKATLSGSSTFNGEKFIVTNTNAILKEDSDYEIQVTDEIILNASDNSETYLYGNPKIIIDRFSGKTRLYKKE